MTLFLHLLGNPYIEISGRKISFPLKSGVNGLLPGIERPRYQKSA